MDLPSRFAEKLRTNDGLNGYVLSTFNTFEPWLRRNDLTFFKEFTDHGSDHIEQVLATIDWLIPDESWSLLTPEDVAVLALSALVHDIGMHLQPDGFLALLEETRVLKRHGDRAWQDLYDAFLTKALQYNGQTLRAMFGSDVPVTRPGADPEGWTNRDRRLIGEFLRQHHHRLAHEIALYGVPGPTEDRLAFAAPPAGYDYLPDFIGLTARSHGVSLRTVIDTIEPADQRQDRNVHLPYLMVLLRVGDYLQIQAQRAPAAQRKVSRLRSPLSQDEWDKHEAIEDMRLDSDINALYVKARPKSAKIFVKLTQLLSGIQGEIDTSWAVLGEQYSRWGEFSALGLRLRRIKSNLDDVAAFSEKVSYIPEQVRFEAADADLLNLLTAPLYGHRPEIGVRELVQNAVDACRELNFYLEQHHLLPPEQASQVADVSLRFKTSTDGLGGTVTVQDKGIGMTVDTVKSYFLKAGASFRKSPLWRETYLDEKGNAQILRAGRFGIGVLAAFLLGRELTVTTRHVNDAQGVQFRCTIDSDFIELERVDAHIGTTVEVRVDQDVWAALDEDRAKADWYCLRSPSLRITWDGKHYEQKHQMPAYGAALNPPWSRLESEEYGEVQWTYDINRPSVVCNGIRVDEEAGEPHTQQFEEFYSPKKDNPFQLAFALPKLSISDPNAALSLSLQRDRVYYTQLPFRNTLFEEVVKDVIAYMLARAPTEPPNTQPQLERYESFTHPSFRWALGRAGLNWFYFTPQGIALFEPVTLRRQRPERLLLASKGLSGALTLRSYEAAILFDDLTSQERAKSWLRVVLGVTDTWEKKVLSPDSIKEVVMSQRFHNLARSSLPQGFQSRCKWRKSGPSGQRGTWFTWTTAKNFDRSRVPTLVSARNLSEQEGFEAVALWQLPGERIRILNDTVVSAIWKEYIGSGVIPFNQHERRAQLAHAYDALEERIAYWQSQ